MSHARTPRMWRAIAVVASICYITAYATADDCNNNGLEDACDLECGTAGGPCDLAGCGQSLDCNANGIPDECDNIGPIIYVNSSAMGNNDGSSWTDAFIELQSALQLAACASTVEELWVAQGVYLPDYDPTTGQHTGDRERSFTLVDNVGVYGGFVGTETLREQRNCNLYPTTLSGDLNGDDGQGLTDDNSYTIVLSLETTDTTILDGFVISGGHSDGDSDLSLLGGGLHNTGDAAIVHCLFENNSAHGGGASCNVAGSPYYLNCIFSNNAAQTYGGAMVNFLQAAPRLTNCLLVGNDAQTGGAFVGYSADDVRLANCTLYDNQADLNGGGIYLYNSFMRIDNSILWNNSDLGGANTNYNAQIFKDQSNTLVYYNCIHNYTNPGQLGNIDNDPLLADPLGGNFHLTAASPCIDAGNNEGIPELPTEPYGYNQTLYTQQWFFAAAVYDGAMMRIYQDGQLIAETEKTGPIDTDGQAPVWIGGNPSGAYDRPWAGLIDEVVVLNKGLKPFEIANLYDVGTNGTAGQYQNLVMNLAPVSYWRMGETSGTTCIDQIGAHHGIYQNGPTLNEPGALFGDADTAVHFDGVDDYVNLTPFDVNGNQLTLLAWFKADTFNHLESHDGRLISKSTGLDADDHDWMLSTIILADGMTTLRFRLKTQGVTTTLIAGQDEVRETEPIRIDAEGRPRFVDQALAANTGYGLPPNLDMGIYEYNDDCNGNGIDDQTDISNQTSSDCNGNLIPDLCETDADFDGVTDDCDLCPETIAGATVDVNGCPTVVFGDFDADGDVDPDDTAVIEFCSSAPGIAQSYAACQIADYDLDGDVDCCDFAAFQRCYSGENRPVDINCP